MTRPDGGDPQRMRRLLYRALRMALVHRVARWRLSHEVIVLGYHGFRARPVEGLANHGGKHLAAETFRTHLAYLKRYHRVLSLEDFLWHRETGTPTPDAAVVLTIDDGYRSVYTHAFPLLKEFSVPATVFLTTDFVENRAPMWTDRIDYCLDVAAPGRVALRLGAETEILDLSTRAGRIDASRRLHTLLLRRHPDAQTAAASALEGATGVALGAAPMPPAIFAPLSWAEVGEMQASGLVSVGSHTHTHAILGRCDPERRRWEVETSRAIIDAQLEGRCRLFCYPNGEEGDYDDDAKRLLRNLGFRCGLTTVAGTNDVSTDPYAIRRYIVSDREGFEGFLMKIYGCITCLSELKRRWGRAGRPS